MVSKETEENRGKYVTGFAGNPEGIPNIRLPPRHNQKPGRYCCTNLLDLVIIFNYGINRPVIANCVQKLFRPQSDQYFKIIKTFCLTTSTGGEVRNSAASLVCTCAFALF